VRDSVGTIFRIFLGLGLTSFGGPIAHLGYYRREFVERRRWLTESAYADLVALCQFLPGPASSQVSFALGVSRGGIAGGLAAWIAFTLPSALIMVGFAYASGRLEGPLAAGALHGLKLVAVAVVAQAVWGMARSLCPDRERASIAVLGALVVTVAASAVGQIAAIAAGGLLGLWLCRAAPADSGGRLPVMVSRRSAWIALAAFTALLLGLPLAARLSGGHALAEFDAFYRAGALVFGGGHVVLPLLEAAVVSPGWVSRDAFLAGYGAAQAMPGPLFTLAAYLGAVMVRPPSGVAGAALCLVAIFLPGLLIVTGALPFWDAFRRRAAAQAAMRGVNAAVVGILLAALYHPVWTGSVRDASDFALALVAFALLVVWALPSWSVVLLTALGGVLLAGRWRPLTLSPEGERVGRRTSRASRSSSGAQPSAGRRWPGRGPCRPSRTGWSGWSARRSARLAPDCRPR
jgi:chromate transporter